MSISICRLMLISAAALTLASCGGGGDDAAGPSRMVVNPSEVIWSGPKSLCLTGEYEINDVSNHVINGGVPPFRIISMHGSAIPTKTELTGKDPEFQIVAKGSCATESSSNVIVLDYHSNMFTVVIKFANYDDEDEEPVQPTSTQ
jgi:hypothetical protein